MKEDFGDRPRFRAGVGASVIRKTSSRIARSFSRLIDAPEVFKPYIPGFTYLLTDLSHLNDREIKGEVIPRGTCGYSHTSSGGIYRTLGRFHGAVTGCDSSTRRIGNSVNHVTLFERGGSAVRGRCPAMRGCASITGGRAGWNRGWGKASGRCYCGKCGAGLARPQPSRVIAVTDHR
jgi:hypothetical protein